MGFIILLDKRKDFCVQDFDENLSNKLRSDPFNIITQRYITVHYFPMLPAVQFHPFNTIGTLTVRWNASIVVLR